MTITDQLTLQRTTHRISIDPAVDTLNDVLTRLDAIPGLQASRDAATGLVTLRANTGHQFDFAGRLDQQPASSSITGTAAPTVGGQYTGTSNTNWTITAIDSGTIGGATPLRLEVRDTVTGNLLDTIDVGAGYTAGQLVALPEGVRLQLATGTLNSGDSWTIAPVANPDTARLLPALGIGGFFADTADGGVRVADGIRVQPARLALSRTGLAGDQSNLARLLQLRDEPIGSFGGASFEEHLASLIGMVGSEVRAATIEQEHLDNLQVHLSEQRAAVSGVDVNEEMLRLLQFQQAFQSAARFVSSVNESMEELFAMIR
ncbi:MAG: flagellar basal body rod C-terminal domain-containing protein [Planctomycetaceae bacterium]